MSIIERNYCHSPRRGQWQLTLNIEEGLSFEGELPFKGELPHILSCARSLTLPLQWDTNIVNILQMRVNNVMNYGLFFRYDTHHTVGVNGN